MNKIILIIKREYLTRVKKKSFLLLTLLTPLGIAAFGVLAGFIMSYQSDDAKRVAIIDEAGVFVGGIKDEEMLKFEKTTASLDTVKAQVARGDYDGAVLIPKITNLYAKSYEVQYYTDQDLTRDVEGGLRERVRDAVRDYRSRQLGLEAKAVDALRFDLTVDPEPINDDAKDATSMTGAISMIVSFAMVFAMYMVIFIYGMMVMRSVMEEKTTRIVEVMISSVKPFELMLGKIVGVGLVGLTQLSIWLVLIPALSMLTSLIFGIDTSPDMPGMEAAAAGADPEQLQGIAQQFAVEVARINWWAIVPLFVLYFLSGYFLYASMFAAVGSAVGEDMSDGQSLTIPITIPVILAFYIAFAATSAPNSSLAVWSSMFPLFSPIVMPARLVFNPPFWQVALSLTLLIGTVLGFIWLSGRIYRTGILLYGKKASFSEIAKWMWKG